MGVCIPERKKSSSLLLITSPRKIRNQPRGPLQAWEIQPRTWEFPALGSPGAPRMERPCLSQAFPHPSPLRNVPLLSRTLLLTRTLEF